MNIDKWVADKVNENKNVSVGDLISKFKNETGSDDIPNGFSLLISLIATVRVNNSSSTTAKYNAQRCLNDRGIFI